MINKMTLRLIYVSTGEPDFRQAHSIQTFYTCKYLRRFFQIELVYPLTMGSLTKGYVFRSYLENGIAVRRLPTTSFGRLASLFHLPKWTESMCFLFDRIIYSVIVRLYYLFSKDNVFFLRDTISSLFIRKPIVELHSLENLETNSMKHLTEKLEKKVLYGAASLITLTKALRSFVSNRYGLYCHVVPDAYEPTIFDSLPEKSEARKLLRINKMSKIVAFSGLKLSGKGADILLESGRFLHETEIYIVGGSQEEIEFLYRLLRNRSIENVKLVGKVDQRTVGLYLAASDVLVLPYPSNIRNEMFSSPLKLFEYMGCNRPIVATKVGSLTEILGKKDAIFVSPGDPEALAKGIKIAFTEKGQESATRLQRKRHLFTYEARAKKIARIVRSLQERYD